MAMPTDLKTVVSPGLDDRVPAKRVRIDCDGSAFGIEDEVAEAVAQQTPAEQPVVTPIGPREDEPTA